ncbi:MAG TPA: hypothetical protein VMZ29_07825 [Candidatus Bathyarchaeia archaeon]|nr:hypothetical protein [Candidatus Bathyarchaeia archaeon]
MSDYIIKTYEKGIEDEQAKLGTEVTKDWKDFGQTSAENLKQAYAQEGFDPETRFYAYKGDKLVGFMVSRILPETDNGIKRVQHDTPFAYDNDREVGKLLYQKGMETWKAKGVNVVEFRVCKKWGNTIEIAEELAYKKARIHYVKTEIELDQIKSQGIEDKFIDFEPERDKEQLIQYFQDNFNMSKEQATANFDGIVNVTDGFYNQPIIREGDKITSRGLVYVSKENPEIATFRPLTPDPNKYIDSYLARITKFAKEKGAKKFEVYFGGQALDTLDLYKAHGFKVATEVFIYEKEI